MRVLVAPDSFGGTIDAVGAARAIAEGWASARPADEVTCTPMADGGEGLLAAVAHSRPDAAWHEAEVASARGIATTAQWLTLPGGVAVIETAQACGLAGLPADDRDPLFTTTYGVGQLLLAAAPSASRMIVGLGGSATVDGGAGMVSALTGHALRREDGNGVKVGGRWVRHTTTLRPFPPLDLPPVQVASDVTSPLLGPDGAARVYGPQKGASPEAVEELEEALTRYAEVMERDLPGGPWRDLPGAGAAGGLGFALMALLGATVESGADLVADLVGLAPSTADLVITGEGSLDAQTAAGKAPAVVARRAREAGTPVMAIAGRATAAGRRGFVEVEELGPAGLDDPAGALRRAGKVLAARI